ncbi:CAP domain-containing protein [Geodermatophilus chilensis]|uniref:CAP domain-containing protein n=1 Tax=Geodermatophilus chilensis TaxID=2035835 RepID=UPI001E3FC5A6|nr:CAP domain-containing protein [Geodermatophilus chilensis]
MPLLLVAGAVAVVTVGAPMVSGVVTSFTDPVALESTPTPDGSAPAVTGSAGSSSAPGGSVDVPSVQTDSAPAPQTPAATPAAPSSAGVPSPVSPSAPARTAATTSDAAVPVEEPATRSATDADAEAEAGAPAVETGTEPAPVARAAVPTAPTAEAAVLALANEARADAGCGALTADPALAAVARAHSADMRDRDYFSHTSPEGLSPFDRAEQAGIDYSRAENIAYGQADAAAVMEAWLESPGHRANILDCDLTKLGVGVAEGPGGPWWTQLFGA